MGMFGKMSGAALLLALVCGPVRAEDQKLSAAEACSRLKVELGMMSEQPVTCQPGASIVTLGGIPEADAVRLEKKLFPGRRYHGNTVVLASDQVRLAAADAAEAKGAPVEAAQAPAPAAAVDFDNSGALRDAAADPAAAAMGGLSGKTILAGPPGSGGREEPARQVPPGSKRSGPPGSNGGKTPPPPPVKKGPPGSGGQTPPQTGTTPPSRPTPVWREHFPPPPPNWWNTDWDHYEWWETLPYGYERHRTERLNEDTWIYYSPYLRWTNSFVTNWGRTQDSARIVRTQQNQHQVHTRSLTSQSYRDVKQCYYRAVYRYKWREGGFHGTHWEESFDHYDARCVRLPREYGTPRVYTVNVAFDMGQAQAPAPGMLDLPWESDVIRLSYDGEGTPRYDLADAVYKYSIRLDNRSWASENVTLVAGAKIASAPEADKVKVFLRAQDGRVELAVIDDRADFYRGETLRVTAKVTQRYVIKSWGGWWNTKVDTVIYNQPMDIVVGGDKLQSVVDLTSQVRAAAQPSGTVLGKSVILDEFSFSRVNSKISTDAVIRRYPGQELPY